MQLSRVTPINIDVFEFLLPKLELMLVRPSYKGDEKTAEARFISYLQELSFDSEQTQKLIKNIEYWQRRVDDEYESMRKKADGYVKLYATNYNKYYTRTKEYQTQASRASSLMANIYTEFTNTEIIERKRIYDNGLNRIKHSVFDNSPINAPHVQTTLWGLNSFSDSVKLAFSNLQNLFARLKEMFQFATKIDNLVEELRKDKCRVLEIFNKCKAKKEAEIKYLLDGLGLPYLESIFPDLVKDLKTMDFDDFVVKYYHELDEQEFTYLIPLYRLVLKKNYGLNNDECSLYEDITDVEQKVKLARMLRILMAHIEELDFKGNKVRQQKVYYVSTKFIAFLMKKVEIPNGKGKEFVESYFKQHYKGDYVVPKFGGVNAEYNKYTTESEEYIDFDKNANRIIEAAMNAKDNSKEIRNPNRIERSQNRAFSYQNQMTYNPIMNN